MADTYADAFLDPLRARSTKVFVVVEVLLVAAGFLIAQRGTEQTSLGAHPDVHFAMGGVFGAMAIAFAGGFVLIYVLLVALSVRSQSRVRTEF
jgi:hypothetical protein